MAKRQLTDKDRAELKAMMERLSKTQKAIEIAQGVPQKEFTIEDMFLMWAEGVLHGHANPKGQDSDIYYVEFEMALDMVKQLQHPVYP